jgi:hypothetical protein
MKILVCSLCFLNWGAKMKVLLILTLFSFTTLCWSSDDWKVIAESTGPCEEKREILAKVGEPYVFIQEGVKKIKLFSEDGSVFNEESPKALVFTNTQNKLLRGNDKKFTFYLPSFVDGNPPKLDIVAQFKNEKCRLKTKR